MVVTPHLARLREERTVANRPLGAVGMTRRFRGRPRDRAHRPDRKGQPAPKRFTADPAQFLPYRLRELPPIGRAELGFAVDPRDEPRHGIAARVDRKSTRLN